MGPRRSRLQIFIADLLRNTFPLKMALKHAERSLRIVVYIGNYEAL
jgi:hypothetical protein